MPVHALEESIQIEKNTIVVGVDGSEHSRSAVKWASDEAKRRGSLLRLDLRGDQRARACSALV